MSPDVNETIRYFSRLLSERKAPWAIAGALAANAYRLEARTTTDIDLVIEIDEPGYSELTGRLRQDGWTMRPAGGERLAFPDIARLRHPSLMPADLLLAKTPYQSTAVARAAFVDVLSSGEPLPCLTAEDVVIHKLLASRHRDLDDLDSLAKAGVALDEDYVRRWCEEWEILDRWENYRRSRPFPAGRK